MLRLLFKSWVAITVIELLVIGYLYATGYPVFDKYLELTGLDKALNLK